MLASVGALAIHYVTAAFEREQMRDMFSRFVPENVVDEVLASADEGLRLGGVQREGTVLFSDLRGFTSFAEELQPPQVIEVLNRYLSEMSDAILDHGGTLVAYMGDGIMAVFGAPIAKDDHADRALAAAREMLGHSPRPLQRLHQGGGARRGLPDGGRPEQRKRHVRQRRLRAARGVHRDRRHHEHRGAARGHDQGHPVQLFLAEATRDYLQEPADDLIFVDEFEVRGRQAKIRLWTLPDPVREADAPTQSDRTAEAVPPSPPPTS